MRHYLLFALCFSGVAFSDNIVSSIEIQADGTPSQAIGLEIGKTYHIKVSGAANLGKNWIEHSPLANDACYEFIASTGKETSQLNNFRNSLDISVCSGTYHLDHTYVSEAFTAESNRIHFWIHDTDYSDNAGSLHVDIIQVE